MEEGTTPAVVLDGGSGLFKAGFAGKDTPDMVIPTVIGRPRRTGLLTVSDQSKCYVGKDALQEELTSRYPVERGIVTNWDDMEKIWHHVFHNELQIDPKDHRVLLTEVPRHPKANREINTVVMFETFECPAMAFRIGAVLGLFPTATTTGAVLDCGDGMTHSMLVYEGYSLPHSIYQLEFGGRRLTDYLVKILMERGCPLSTSTKAASLEANSCASEIKEKCGYVALDFEEEMEKSFNASHLYEKEYVLPSGETIRVGNERFRCAEGLFQPSFVMDFPDDLANFTSCGIHELIYNSIMKSDRDIRRDVYNNIVLCGGSTMFPGLTDRLQKELVNLAPPQFKVRVVAPPVRRIGPWLGGSILASMSSNIWLTKAQYEEEGPPVVHKVCIS